MGGGGGGREGARLDWAWLSCDQMATASERASSEGASGGAGSRKSFVHSDPYRKLKTEPIQVVLLFAPLYDFSSSLRSR